MHYSENAAQDFPHSNTLLSHIEIKRFKQFIQDNKKHSSTVRSFYRREIILNKNNPNLLHPFTNGVSDPLDFCIKDSLSTRDVLISADLFLLNYKLYPNEPLNHLLASEIVSALTFQDPRYDHLHLIKLLGLIKLFKQKNESLQLTSTQLNTITNKALSLNHYPSLKKKILIETMNDPIDTTFISRNHWIKTAYHLIHNDYKLRNAAGVYLTWCKIADYYNSLQEHDIKILNMVLKTFMNNKTYKNACKDIISKLSPQHYSNDALILPTIIAYFTKAGNLVQAQTLMDNVNTNIKPENTRNVLHSRRCLSSLLKMHLQFNDSEGVDRVLKLIHEIHGGHSPEDFQSIVAHLLKSKTLDNIAKAVNLVSQIPKTKALLAYGSIINTIVDWQIASNGRFDKKSMKLLNDILANAHQADPDYGSTLWSILASLYIKKLVHYKNFKKNRDSNRDTTNLDLAKLIFLKSTSKTAKLPTINPFSYSSPPEIILKITDTNKIIILRNIALSAIKGYRKDIFLWCCTELYHKGVPVEELILDWHAMFDYRLRSPDSDKLNEMREKVSNKSSSFIKTKLK